MVGFGLEPNQAGIMITCMRTKEGRCVQEMRTLLTEYVEKLMPHLSTAAAPPKAESLEDQIARELAELKRPQVNPWFTSLNTGTECVIFFRTSPRVDPVALVSGLMADLAVSQRKVTRFANRIIPVSRTCVAHMPDITKMARTLLDPIFNASVPNGDVPASGADAETTPVAAASTDFAIVPKIRNNQKVERMALIENIAEIVGPNHVVNLENPRYVILVEVLKSICMISVVENYYLYRKFNLFSLTEDTPTKSSTPAKESSVAE
ncbi:hypothetical protein BJ085DRAFT_23764 [Dimargaris cristalligena]|uniref:THUMP domain-containing protein n=1 Tax=Dimargaris cristalligena TaxID=215637 RepID=A0A4Q0A292_9FUNG|nr:hypothetical protein BJ085DRAFT_23764 [Dimargaris cristalligena]|eukprot:RKP39290.1 hypothetical protein BJ085DRAFT_23764 [Dimargaris cristalligena]